MDTLLRQAVATGIFPGAVLEVGRSSGALFTRACGAFTYEPDARRMRTDTRFDLASLTKVIATTNVAMRLLERGLFDLDDPLCKYVREFRGGAREQVTLRHLLTHSSGLPAWRPYFEKLRGEQAFVEAICREPLDGEPGERYRYSDLGMILLGIALERMGGASLEQLFQAEVVGPLGLCCSGYRPPPDLRSRCAPTERCEWRGGVIQGVVHDENAWALGGVAGHAGVFSCAADLGAIARMLLAGGLSAKGRFLRADTIASFTRCQDLPPGSARALGWGTARAPTPSCGRFFSARSYGHTGFTGTSLWCDPERDLYVVLLTNRVHPTRANRRIRAFRPRLHDAVVRSLDPRAIPRR